MPSLKQEMDQKMELPGSAALSECTLALFLVAVFTYAAVALSPFFLLLIPVILLLVSASTWKWIKEEARKAFRPTPEEAEQQRIDSEIRQKADELAGWESLGALDAKTKPVGEWQPPHGPACRCEECSAYWRGWRESV